MNTRLISEKQQDSDSCCLAPKPRSLHPHYHITVLVKSISVILYTSWASTLRSAHTAVFRLLSAAELRTNPSRGRGSVPVGTPVLTMEGKQLTAGVRGTPLTPGLHH